MPVSRKELIRKLRSFGFTGPHSGGKHQFMARGELKLRIPNPHKKSEIGDNLLFEIIRQAELSKDQWGEA